MPLRSLRREISLIMASYCVRPEALAEIYVLFLALGRHQARAAQDIAAIEPVRRILAAFLSVPVIFCEGFFGLKEAFAAAKSLGMPIHVECSKNEQLAEKLSIPAGCTVCISASASTQPSIQSAGFGVAVGATLRLKNVTMTHLQSDAFVTLSESSTLEALGCRFQASGPLPGTRFNNPLAAAEALAGFGIAIGSMRLARCSFRGFDCIWRCTELLTMTDCSVVKANIGILASGRNAIIKACKISGCDTGIMLAYNVRCRMCNVSLSKSRTGVSAINGVDASLALVSCSFRSNRMDMDNACQELALRPKRLLKS